MANTTKELESQIALAMAAVGLTFAQTLADADVPEAVNFTLKRKALALREHLQSVGADKAADMFSTFVAALHDPQLGLNK